jgi:hypothetical protein
MKRTDAGLTASVINGQFGLPDVGGYAMGVIVPVGGTPAPP